MFAVRMMQLIETHADVLSEGLAREMRTAPQCQELLRKVPADELKRRSQEIYCHLGEWLTTKTESEIEERYVGLGIRRARQGVSFSTFLWAVTSTKEYLWEFLEGEGLVEQPVELIGELDLLHSLERFFDRVLYFASIGYEHEQREQREHLRHAHVA
jgi:hypothetical protein